MADWDQVKKELPHHARLIDQLVIEGFDRFRQCALDLEDNLELVLLIGISAWVKWLVANDPSLEYVNSAEKAEDENLHDLAALLLQ